jgi:HK97 gp10 family phage protein
MSTTIKKNPNFDEDMQKGFEKEFAQLLQNMVDEAKFLVPVRTGKLRSTIKIINNNGLEGEFGTNGSEYAKFVEMGTIKMDAQPFIRAAVDNVLLGI